MSVCRKSDNGPRGRGLRKGVCSLALLGIAAACAAPGPLLSVEELARAKEDECFRGLGSPDNVWPWDPDTDTPFTDACTNGKAKVNQMYVWGLTLCGPNVWFGTAANPACQVLGTFLDSPTPSANNSQVCEYDLSPTSPPAAAAVGDWRPPEMYWYDTNTDTLTAAHESLDADGEARRQNTLGIRAAGCHNGVVFLAGPSLPVEGDLGYSNAVHVFAFNGETGEYLGSDTWDGYSNIRSWVVAGDHLYTGLSTLILSGEIWKWTGDLANPFQFQTVGYLPSEPAYLAAHEDRLLVTTWSGLLGPGAALWMSPRLPSNGLSAWHALWWRNLWESSEYEPDPVLDFTYGGGAIVSLGDCFIWGTIHVPLLTAQVHILLYGEPQTDDDQLAVYLNTLRTTSVFRGHLVRRPGLWGWLSPDFEYDLLYGQEQFTIWNPDLGTNGEWETVDNASGLVPLYGPSGFQTAPYPPPYNISYNFYLWSGAALNGQGYFGTLDLYDNSNPSGWRGADLWRFPSCNEPATAEFLDGGADRRSYGVRTMVTDGTVLFMGMASQDNLRTVYNGDSSYGGWRLLRGTPPP